MFCQLFSPPRSVKPKRLLAIPRDPEEEYILLLAPFTVLPKICFNDVPLGTVCSRTLIIRNPTANHIQLFVTKIPPEERRLKLSWYEETIPSNKDVLLELQWAPDMEGSWRETITLQDGGRLKKDVSINLKCFKIKKLKPKSKPKPTVISSKVKSPLRRKLSPAKKLSPSKAYRKPLPDITNHPTVIITTCKDFVTSSITNSPNTSCWGTTKDNKENVFDLTNTEFDKSNFCVGNVTFGMPEPQMKSPVRSLSSETLGDNLETLSQRNVNISETIEERIKQLAFTPSINSHKESSVNEEVGDASYYLIVPGKDTCRKLNISSSTQIRDSIDLTSPKGTITNCNLSPIRNCRINNKTFEVSSCIAKDGLELIIEETSDECALSNNKVAVSNTSRNKKKVMTPQPKLLKAELLNLKQFLEKSVVKTAEVNSTEVSVKLHDTKGITPSRNPLVLTAANDIDPFISASIYYNLQWVDEQEKSFKKWLNALLTPPLELNSNANLQVDVGKLWNDCKKREVSKAPTREVISNNYHVKSRLDSLRKTAFQFITSQKMAEVLSKVHAIVDNNTLQIRNDRDVHLDLSLQSEIMILLISYNPLWLRIGLETIYGVTVPLHSNSDIMGLSVFISENFFKDRYLLKKYKSAQSQKYSCNIKKLVLQKFLMLIYFLDQAKLKQLIPHNPCLFSKKAPYKESREILLKFSRDLLFAVGDVTKFLSRFGFILSHKQTYIHEFDYAVSDLGKDLRDGIRLTRVMEIILLKDNLIEQLRVPAISRLQKIHNMKIVFDALTKADFRILHDIESKDIVDGHKEKTLSFLWQIIYKFEAPRLKKAVITIQNWWRSLFIIIKRNIIRKDKQKQLDSAIKIQQWYRKMLLSRMYENLISIVKEIMVKRQIRNAACKIQSFFKMIVVRKNYLKLRMTIISLQSYSQRWLVLQQTERKLIATIKIQSTYRMYKQRKFYLKLKTSVRNIENFYLAKKLALQTRNNYLLLKSAVLFVQQKYLANRKMKITKENYLKLKQVTLVLQQKYRATKLMIIARKEFLELKNAALNIQKYYRANKIMQTARNDYLKLLSATVFIQKIFRTNRLMKKEKQKYSHLKKSYVLIQQRFRANRLMKIHKESYKKLVQTTKFIQQRFREKQLMLKHKHYYTLLKKYVLILQTRYRTNKLGTIQRKKFLQLKGTAVYIQRKYRAKKLMEIETNYYNLLKKYVFILQARYCAKKLGIIHRKEFLQLKETAVFIQRKYRANKLMEIQRNDYQKTLKTIRFIQTKFKAKMAMKKQLNHFIQLKKYVILIQRKFRANTTRKLYLNLREKIIIIQRWHKSVTLMKIDRNNYLHILNMIKLIQIKYKAKLLMKQQFTDYNLLRKSALLIQRRYRANRKMKEQRKAYLDFKEKHYQNMTKAAVTIQAYYKGYIVRKTYKKLYEAVIFIQRTYKSKLQMKQQRDYYQKLRKAAIHIQRLFKARKLGKIERQTYLILKRSVLVIEDQYIAKKLMVIEMERYQSIRNAARIIQECYSSYRMMKEQKTEYDKIRRNVKVIQLKFRAYRLGEMERRKYLNTKEAVQIIQKWYRQVKNERTARNVFITMLQAHVRGFLTRRKLKVELSTEKLTERTQTKLKIEAATKIQALWRGYYIRSKQKKRMIEIREKLKAANRNWQIHQTLGVRMEKASLVCLYAEFESTYELNRALRELDFQTRVSKTICIKLSTQLVEFLYETINSAARSEPERETLTLSTSILINFWKIPEARENLWCPKHMDNIVTKMTNWCDKNNSLFIHLCTLLWLLAHNNKYKRLIKGISQYIQRFAKIKVLCERKQKMMSKSSGCTHSYFGPYKCLPLPGLEPDWGIDYKKRPKTFTNSMQAILNLIDILESKNI